MAMKTKLVTLGSRLKYHRKKNQLTQKVVAELIGVSSSAISQYEKGSMNRIWQYYVNWRQFIKYLRTRF